MTLCLQLVSTNFFFCQMFWLSVLFRQLVDQVHLLLLISNYIIVPMNLTGQFFVKLCLEGGALLHVQGRVNECFDWMGMPEV